MKPMKYSPTARTARSLVLAFVAATLATDASRATPYATSLTNNAGTVSFRLNETTGTNDTVKIIWNGGVRARRKLRP